MPALIRTARTNSYDFVSLNLRAPEFCEHSIVEYTGQDS